jgi:hypothetical protein
MRTVRLGDWASKRRQLSLIFQTFARWQQKCVRHHCRDRPTGRRFGQAEVPSNTKGSRFCGRGRETGNRDECHVHAPSTGCASCGIGRCIVCHRRVDRPCGIRAYKGVLGRKAERIRSGRPHNSRRGFWKVSVTGAPRSEAGRAGWAAPFRRSWDYPRLHRQEALALQFLACELARPADCFRLLSGSLFGGFFIMAAELHLTEDALALHFLLQHLEGLVDIVVTNENLHARSSLRANS